MVCKPFFGWYTEHTHLERHHQPASRQTESDQSSPRKGMHIKSRFKGYKNNPFDLGVMFILFSVLTTNRQLKKCHLL